MNALRNVGNGAPEEIAAEDHGPDPDDAPEDIENEIARVWHFGGTSDGWTKCADDRNEARKNHCAPAVFFVEIVGLLQMAAPEEKRILPLVESRSRGSANPITNLIADDGAKHNWAKKPFQRNYGTRRKYARSDEEGIARKKEANEEPGFDKNNCTDEWCAAGAD